MRINDMVKFTNKGGTRYNQEHALEYLELGKIYRVEKVEEHDWHTKIHLENFDVSFNSVQFHIVKNSHYIKLVRP